MKEKRQKERKYERKKKERQIERKKDSEKKKEKKFSGGKCVIEERQKLRYVIAMFTVPTK